MFSTSDSISQFNQLLEVTRMRVDEVSAALVELNERSDTGRAAGDSSAGDHVAGIGVSVRNALRQGGNDVEESMTRSLQTALQIARTLSSVADTKNATGGLFGFLGGLFSLIGGFESGGYTGNTPGARPAGIVHGGEVVFEKPIVDRHRDALLALRKRLSGGGGIQEAIAGMNIDVAGSVSNPSDMRAVLAELRGLREAWGDVRIEPAITIGQSFDTQRFFIDGDVQLQTYKRKKMV